jgi:transcription factor C subunit 6
MNQSKELDGGQMKCEMVLCLDGGPAQEIRWCPLPSHDRVGQAISRVFRLV